MKTGLAAFPEAFCRQRNLSKKPFLQLAHWENATYILVDASDFNFSLAGTVKKEPLLGHPRQRQTRRETGTQSYGLLTVRGGAV